MTIRYGKLKHTIGRLGLLRLRRLYRFVLGQPKPPEDDDEVPPGDILVLLTAAILASRRPVKEEQQDFLLEELGAGLREFGTRLATAGGTGKLPVVTLTLLDGRYARLWGQEETLDLRTGERLRNLPLPPIEIVSFELTALYRRTLASLSRPDPQPASVT